MNSVKQKQSLYFPDEMLREIAREANRLDRSLSWTVQQAWRIGRSEVRKLPSVGHRPEAERELHPSDAEGGAAGSRQPSAQVLEFLKGKFETALTG